MASKPEHFTYPRGKTTILARKNNDETRMSSPTATFYVPISWDGFQIVIKCFQHKSKPNITGIGRHGMDSGARLQVLTTYERLEQG